MQQASLQQLNDIVEPGAASWWPPAWPVIAIAAVLLLLVILLALWLWRRYRASKPQRIALQKLEQLQRPSASDITLLCKRVALVYFPRQRIAQLTGQAWLRFLGAPGELIARDSELLYQAGQHQLIKRYQHVALQWIKQARQQARREAKQAARGEHV